MKTPTEILLDEHRLILEALWLLDTAADRLDRGEPFPTSWWPDVLGWLRGFADRNQHTKEERSLFPALVKAGIPDGEGGPIAVMLEEHGRGRGLIQAMESGDPPGRASNARLYVQLLRAHIDKENGVLFPLADGVLEPEAQRALQREFEQVAQDLGRDASIAHAEGALEGLKAALRTRGASGAR